MGKIVISHNVTVDGVVQDPTGEEGFSHGGWFVQVGKNDRDAFYKAALNEALGAEAFLVGRRTYEFLASRWPSRTGELADRLNSLPKYVVSSTLEDPEWSNTQVLKGDLVAGVSCLKELMDGEIVVPGGHHLVGALIKNGLADEMRLLVYPYVLGAGHRLFDEISDKVRVSLVSNQTVGDELAYLTYKVLASSGPQGRASL